MVIEHIFDSIRLVLNKDRRGFVKTSKIATAVRMAMYDIFNEELEIYRQTGIISSKIKQFTKTASVVLTDGNATLPTDFIREINFFTNEGNEGVFLDQEEYRDRANSVILTPDETYPIGIIKSGKVYVKPSSFPAIKLDYFRIPNEFVYATTVSNDERSEVFDPTSSTDIEFDYAMSGDIIRRALLYLGAGYQNPEAAQIGTAQ
jgi:hypothetical protein